SRQLTVGAGSAGTLTLASPANFYSGGTNLNAALAGAPTGALVVGAATALGTGALTLTAGTLQVGGAFALPNAVTLNGGLVVLGGSNPITFNGAATLANGTTTALQVNAPTAFAGGIGAGGTGNLALLGGTLNLTTANAYTGSTIVSGGNLTLS